jgi:heme o synthase
VKHFIGLTKPGIIFGNIVTLAGGFFLASQGNYDLPLLFVTMLAMALIVGGGCAFNNYLDQDIDVLMSRTRNRVLVKGLISNTAAIIFAVILSLAGLLLLLMTTNLLTTGIAFFGLFFYVVIYTLFLKRTSIYGTIIGGLAGAVPPVVGYCAVTNHFDMGALLLFIILFAWQIPHFYAISIYRLEDFRAASIPILPLKKDIFRTKISMLLYILVFMLAAVMPVLYGYTGYVYTVFAVMLSLMWFVLGLLGFKTSNDIQWSRQMFLFSIIVITILSFMMAI